MSSNQDPSAPDRDELQNGTPSSSSTDSDSTQDDVERLSDRLSGDELEHSATSTDLEASNDSIEPDSPRLLDESSNDSSSSMESEGPYTENNDPIASNEDSNISNVVPIHNEDSNPMSTGTEDSNLSAALQTRKKSECDEPPAKVRKVNSPEDSEDIDGDTCPICLESWGNAGDHKLVSLKCGHLFGAECVKRWIKAQPTKAGSCPTCKSKATLRDLRFIYAKRLVATDTSEICALQKQLEIVQAEKNQIDCILRNTKIAHQACLLQLEVLRTRLNESQVSRESVKKSWSFALEKNMEISKDAGCRVMTYNCRTYELYVSQKSSSNLFPGYGIRRVSCLDLKLGQFIHLHSKPIRDITYSPHRDLLLTVGLDSCVKILDHGGPKIHINVGFPVWCCSWDNIRTNNFYVGGTGGTVLTYDIRNVTRHLDKFSYGTDMSPVISVCPTPFGLLSCQLNKCWLWYLKGRQLQTRDLSLQGPFMCMRYNSDINRVLVSTRPNAHENSNLIVCSIAENAATGMISIDVNGTYPLSSVSTVMTRAAWVKAPGALWIAAYSESEKTLRLKGLDGTKSISLPANEPALDVCPVQVSDNNMLAALSESRLRLYKAVATAY